MSHEKVYALFNGSYDDRELWDIYATLELAQAAAESVTPHQWAIRSEGLWGCDGENIVGPRGFAFGCEYSIEEHPLIRESAAV